jgi:hypothetical protein
MSPPKVDSLGQATRKTLSNHRSLQEPIEEEQVYTQLEGIVDVDVIPSP